MSIWEEDLFVTFVLLWVSTKSITISEA